jgi:hypothetical protein
LSCFENGGTGKNDRESINNLPPNSLSAQLDSTFESFASNLNKTRNQLTVNPISRTHAEADAFQQAFDLGHKGGRARLIVDRDLCRACGQNGGVKGMARQLDLEEIEIISPSGRQIISLK